MDDLSIFLAQLLGLYFVIAGVIIVVRRKSLIPVVAEFGYNRSLILIVALLASALLVLNFGLNLITVSISILLVEFLFGFIGPILNNYFHKYVDSHNRATMSSLRSFGTGISVAILAPLFGKIADWYSYPSMFLALGATMLVFTIPSLLKFVRSED
jgi:MFS family permease